jgi:hypothetical protein
MEVLLKAFNDKGEEVADRHWYEFTMDELAARIEYFESLPAVVRVTVDIAFKVSR